MLLQPSHRARAVSAGSHRGHLLDGRGGVPRATVDRVRDGKHACRIRVLPPEACPEVPQHLDDLIRRARHSPPRSGARRASVGQERSMALIWLLLDICGTPIPVRLAQNRAAQHSK